MSQGWADRVGAGSLLEVHQVRRWYIKKVVTEVNAGRFLATMAIDVNVWCRKCGVVGQRGRSVRNTNRAQMHKPWKQSRPCVLIWFLPRGR